MNSGIIELFRNLGREGAWSKFLGDQGSVQNLLTRGSVQNFLTKGELCNFFACPTQCNSELTVVYVQQN